MTSATTGAEQQASAAPGGKVYYSIKEVASKLGVSERWLADQCRKGFVEHVHLARKRRFTPGQLDKLLRTHTIQAGKEVRDDSARGRTGRRIGMQPRR